MSRCHRCHRELTPDEDHTPHSFDCPVFDLQAKRRPVTEDALADCTCDLVSVCEDCCEVCNAYNEGNEP